MRWLAVLALLLLPAVAAADPFTVTSTGTIPLITYTEPTTYTTGAPITDLKETHIKWRIGTGAITIVVVPATKLTGGGAITNNNILTPILPCQSNTINVSVSAVTVALVESADAVATTLLVDRTKEAVCVTPSAPTNVIAQ